MHGCEVCPPQSEGDAEKTTPQARLRWIFLPMAPRQKENYWKQVPKKTEMRLLYPLVGQSPIGCGGDVGRVSFMFPVEVAETMRASDELSLAKGANRWWSHVMFDDNHSVINDE